MDFGNKKNRKYLWFSISFLFLLGLGITIASFAPFSPYAEWWKDEEEEEPTVKTRSTFQLIDHRTGEDVSSWVEISVWTPDPDDVPFDGDTDPYTLTNFEESVSSDDADVVSIDLRSYTNSWLQIDPDYESDYGGYDGTAALGDGYTVSDDFRYLYGGVNHDYIVEVYHLPTNISVTVRDRVTNDEWFDLIEAGTDYARGVDGHYVTELDLPYNDPHGLHAGDDGGDGWEIEDEEYDEMTPAEGYWLRDQKNFRTIAPLYDLNDDDGKNFDDELELTTNCFAVNFTFNTSLSEVATDANWVNFTLYERDYNDIPAEVVFDVTDILVIFYEPITCYDHFYSFEFNIEFNKGINCTGVYTGRIFTPYDDDNLGAWTEINVAPFNMPF